MSQQHPVLENVLLMHLEDLMKNTNSTESHRVAPCPKNKFDFNGFGQSRMSFTEYVEMAEGVLFPSDSSA